MTGNMITDTLFIRRWAVAGGIWLALTALLGIAMRLAFTGNPVLDLPFDHILHAHSHIAFFGWMGSMLFGLFYLYFVKGSGKDFSHGRTILNFWLLQIFSFGAFCSFLAQGYAQNSIIFSALHVFLWYFFTAQVFPFLKKKEFSAPHILARTSLLFLLLSTLGTWALPPIMLNGYGGTYITRIAIDFFVHTFSDGWLITGALAVLFAKTGIVKPGSPAMERQFRVNLALMPLAVLISSPRGVADELPALMQLAVSGACLLLGLLHLHFLWIFRKSFRGVILRSVAVFLLLKGLMEILSVFPFAHDFTGNRFVLILYLHLKLLGIAGLSVVAAMPGNLLSAARPAWYFSPERLFLSGTVLMIAALGMMCLPLLNAEFFPLELIGHGQWCALMAGIILLLPAFSYILRVMPGARAKIKVRPARLLAAYRE